MGLRPYLKADRYPMRKVPSLYQEERNVLTRGVEWQLRNTQKKPTLFTFPLSSHIL